MSERVRYRIRYSKLGKVRFVGHRDLARIWERAFSRARLAVSFSEGYSPHPRISYGLALPVGWESSAEYLDVVLDRDEPELASALNSVLPDGIEVTEIAVLVGKTQSVASAVSSAGYTVWIRETGDRLDTPALRNSLDELRNAESVVAARTVKGTEVAEEIRPLIYAAEMRNAGSEMPAATGYDRYGLPVSMVLATQPRVVRPEELASAMSVDGRSYEAALVRRESQHIEVNGTTLHPMSPALAGNPGAK